MIGRGPAVRDGFTLIEVIGALLIFSAGVIMMLGVTRGLSDSLEHSAVNSILTAEGQERMDSLTALTYSSLPVGTRQDTLTFRGVRYRRRQVVTQFSPLVRKVDVTLDPLSGEAGPNYSATSYLSNVW